MVGTKVNPLEHQDISEIDHLIGKIFLVWELFQIGEFVALWWPALQRQSRAMQAIPKDFADRMTRTSPEGREAFIAITSESEAWRMHSEEAIEEARILVDYLVASADKASLELGEQIDWHSVSYTTLEYDWDWGHSRRFRVLPHDPGILGSSSGSARPDRGNNRLGYGSIRMAHG